MLRLRFFQKGTSLKKLEADQYTECGSFIDSEFNIIRNEKDGTSALLELEKNGSITDPTSNETYPCYVLKRIRIEESQISITIKCKFEKTPGEEDLVKDLINSLDLGIDLPFFFNGEPSKFQWESGQNNYLDSETKQLQKALDFKCNNFKAYDDTYNLHLEYTFKNQSKHNNKSIRIHKFPIIAYVFTDEGYKKIYQGINLLPRFQLNMELEIKIVIDIF